MGPYRSATHGFYPMPIALMILGFVFYWPVGLAILFCQLWGRQMRDGFFRMKRRFDSERFFSGDRAGCGFASQFRSSGNTAFDDYRAAELERLERERRKLDEMRADFDDFLNNLRRAKDQEEFDRFMRGRTTTAA